MCDRQRLSLTVGLEGAWTTARGRPGSPSPSRKASRAGAATRRPAARSPTTGPGCYRGWPRKPSSCAPRSSSAPSPTTSIAAACAGPGFAGRENVHKRYLLHVAGHNLSLLMRQLIGAGTPREAVAGGYGGIFVLLTPAGAMLVAQMVSQSGSDGFRNRLRRVMSRSSESRSKALNQRADRARISQTRR